MSFEADQQRSRRRERMAMSIISLLILFSLLGGYFLLHATQHQEGKLGVLSTSQVTIGVNEEPAAQPAAGAATGEPAPTATASKPAASAKPGLVTEVFSSTDEPGAGASAGSNASGGTTSSSSQSANPTTAPATATARATSGPSIGIVPAGSGGTGGSGSGGVGSFPNPTATSVTSNPTSVPGVTATSMPQPTAGASSTPGSGGPNPTAVPTNPPLPTTEPETVDEPGHHSHLHIDGFVGPGAYKAGGIIVSNLGTVAFDYSVSMTVAGDAAFAQALHLRIYLRVGPTCDYPGQPPSPATDLLPLTGDQVGTVLYDGTFTTGNKIGNPAAFPASGDRHLAVGQSEVLCMEVFFPWGSGNEFQGLGVNGTQTFTAKSPDQ